MDGIRFAGLPGIVSARIGSGVTSAAKGDSRTRRRRGRRRGRRCRQAGSKISNTIQDTEAQCEGVPPIIRESSGIDCAFPRGVGDEVIASNESVENSDECVEVVVEREVVAPGADPSSPRTRDEDEGPSVRDVDPSEAGVAQRAELALSDYGVQNGAQNATFGLNLAGIDNPDPPGVLHILAGVGSDSIRLPILLEDWENVMHYGFHEVAPGAVIAAAYRRVAPRASVLVRLRDRYAQDLGHDAQPQSWLELATFIEAGGSCVLHGRTRGGMDPGHQAVLDATVFGEGLDWNGLDACMNSLRSGNAVAGDVDPQIRRLAEALVSTTELQQWEPLAALPEGILRNCVCSPARVAALQCIVQRHAA